jgi:5-methyltetrahydropteroyltriglutamate--homocysteine methyltransferase
MFRADIIGSFIRPNDLLEVRKSVNGDLSTLRRAPQKPPQLVELENASIRELVKQLENIGLSVVTDGEFRRIYYYEGFLNGLSGTEARFVHDGAGVVFKSGFVAPRIAIVAKLRWPEGGVTVNEFCFLKETAKATAKMTLPSPLHSMFYHEGLIDRSVYPDLQEFWSDMMDVYCAEIAALADAGCRYVQLDETTIIRLCDPKFVAFLESRGLDPKQELAQWVSVLDGVAHRKPAGLTLAIHMCRGNGPGGSWVSTGAYEPIADAVFNGVSADTLLLEYDSERAGGFDPLRHMPADKGVVLGLITPKSPQLEDPSELKRKVDAAAKFVSLDRLGISPQCGFASSVLAPPLTHEDQCRKLELLVSVARDVWGSS